MMHKPHGMSLMIAAGPARGGAAAGASPGADASDDEPMPSHAPEDEDDDEDADDYCIKAPEGFEPPDDTQEGDEFDATIRAKMTDDGKLEIISINGIKTGADEGESNEGEENSEETEGQGDENSTPSSLQDAMDQELGKKPMMKKGMK